MKGSITPQPSAHTMVLHGGNPHSYVEAVQYCAQLNLRVGSAHQENMLRDSAERDLTIYLDGLQTERQERLWSHGVPLFCPVSPSFASAFA